MNILQQYARSVGFLVDHPLRIFAMTLPTSEQERQQILKAICENKPFKIVRVEDMIEQSPNVGVARWWRAVWGKKDEYWTCESLEGHYIYLTCFLI